MSFIRGFQSKPVDPQKLRDAILAVRTENMTIRNACSKLGVPSRIIQSALDKLEIHEKARGAPLKNDSHSHELYRWASAYAKIEKRK